MISIPPLTKTPQPTTTITPSPPLTRPHKTPVTPPNHPTPTPRAVPHSNYHPPSPIHHLPEHALFHQPTLPTTPRPNLLSVVLTEHFNSSLPSKFHTHALPKIHVPIDPNTPKTTNGPITNPQDQNSNHHTHTRGTTTRTPDIRLA